ncbi:MAG: helix-turn-helix domain-containing protein [Fibrobacter sp.]|uniref:AraC family transcriptional regulator n=1 Tax=Fibrobacter sp. TaxID=35828 RepID=UPI0025BAB060|nr:helix-turn-helix transcriptional regulator [Fibrobacter sp.]MBR4785525.1 helix-turn-helix domain-containing protein [Fibrobacter sp.]
MKVLSNKPLHVKDANLAILTPIQLVNKFSDKVVVFDSFEGIGLENYFNIQGAVLLLVKQGKCTIELDLERRTLTKHSCVIVLPNQIARISNISKDIKFICVTCSLPMVEELTSRINEAIPITLRAKQQPVIKLSPSEYNNIQQSFNFLIAKIKKSGKNTYNLQIVQNALLALVYECIGIITKNKNIEQPSSKKEALFNSFINLVSQYHKQEHSVTFYATKLFLTPKYLTRAIEEISHKSAKRWIDEYIMLEAKMMLRSTKMTIQEIASELNFPDISFFGKFFKRTAGISPKAYRENKD